jgi:phytoene synthase
MSKTIFDKVSLQCSRAVTHAYSTSFTFGIRCLAKELRDPVHSLYGFVRLGDEIVDSLHGYDKKKLLAQFREDTHRAVYEKISLNPILNNFQHTVHKFGIEQELYDRFLNSMELDLTETQYDSTGIEEYIYGSAQVVGLMSLRVFCNGDNTLFEQLKPSAMQMGSAFQKINFLRDLNLDYNQMGRNYFPGVDLAHFNDSVKKKIEDEIAKEFRAGREGIKQLPRPARFGVYVAYLYYYTLFKKIKNTPSSMVLHKRVSVHNRRKLSILAFSYLKHRLNLI